MEILPTLEKGFDIAKNVGRFVLHRLDGAHGGWADLPAPANITYVNTGESDELTNNL